MLLVQPSVYYLIVAATVETYLSETVSQLLSRFHHCSLFKLYSPDYVLGKAGLFSTKLSHTISAWTLLFYKIYTKLPFLVASLDLVDCTCVRVSVCVRRGKRLCTIVAQSREECIVCVCVCTCVCDRVGFTCSVSLSIRTYYGVIFASSVHSSGVKG